MRNKLFVGANVVLCVLLFGVKLTGPLWHAALGVMLVIINVSHMCIQFKKLRYRDKKIQIVDGVRMAALLGMFVTGMLMHPLNGMLAVKILHKLTALLFILSMIAHGLQHRKKTAKRGCGARTEGGINVS